MADDENNTSSSDGSPTNAYSGNFDPIKVLYAEKLKIPVPKAPVFDNIDKFESVVFKGLALKVGSFHRNKKKKYTY